MTTQFDLKSPEGLAAACTYVAEHSDEEREKWSRALREFLEYVESADESTRASLPFHKRVWDDNPVSSVGMGTVPVSHVVEKAEFRKWVAAKSMAHLPSDRAGRSAALLGFYEGLIKWFADAKSKIPHLKIFRVLAAFYPEDFTTIAYRWALERLVRRMRGVAGDNPVVLHAYVRDRLDEVIGPAGSSLAERAARLELAWHLYALTEGKAPGEEKVTTQSAPGEEALVPLPAARRRRGLTALAGGFPATLGILQEVKDGLTRDEFLDYLKGLHPNLKEVSRRMIINILRSELGLIKNVNNEYLLTERGSAVLETSSAEEMGDWLVTRVLGIDHLLKRLEEGATPKAEMIELLQRANPGWTSDFAPQAMINWLVSMGAIRRTSSGVLHLEPLGQEWTDRIHWKPEFLQPAESDIGGKEAPPVPDPSILSLPPLPKIVDRVLASGAFPRLLVEQLHLGLWSPSRRHFAVLAGISGSGKTLLAQKYAEALGTVTGDGPPRYMIQAVQPGWYDPSPLLGYLNPLQKDTYQRTAFLTFLLRASQDALKPYVVILDEMNLSHPEQYFAPLLSAMESGNDIHLHAEGDLFDGVPESIPYPANLAIIGTINMDETTHGLSDKVLDRAFTLEFWDIDLATYPRWDKSKLSPTQVDRVRLVLSALMKVLAPSRLHFGWRIVDDIVAFLGSSVQMGAEAEFEALLDSVVYAKILPKLRGEDSPRLRQTLTDTKAALDGFGMKHCAARVADLEAELRRSGSARFWR